MLETIVENISATLPFVGSGLFGGVVAAFSDPNIREASLKKHLKGGVVGGAFLGVVAGALSYFVGGQMSIQEALLLTGQVAVSSFAAIELGMYSTNGIHHYFAKKTVDENELDKRFKKELDAIETAVTEDDVQRAMEVFDGAVYRLKRKVRFKDLQSVVGRYAKDRRVSGENRYINLLVYNTFEGMLSEKSENDIDIKTFRRGREFSVFIKWAEGVVEVYRLSLHDTARGPAFWPSDTVTFPYLPKGKDNIPNDVVGDAYDDSIILCVDREKGTKHTRYKNYVRNRVKQKIVDKFTRTRDPMPQSKYVH